MKRKSIVLSDTDGESIKKGVLTLEEQDGGLSGTLRLYNFSKEPNGILSLGLFCNQQVFKAGLTLKSQMLYDFFVNIKAIPQKFSCAIVNFQNAEPKPVLFGSSDGSDENIYANIISEVSDTKSFEKTKNVLDKYGVDFEDAEKAEIEKEIDQNLCQANCENCIYKKYFYENPREEQNASIEKNEKQNLDYKSQIFGTSLQKDFEDAKSTNVFEQKTADGTFQSNVAQNRNERNENLNLSASMSEEKEESKNEDNEQKIIFFDRLKPQIDKLFESNPAETNLQSIFPSSKWVKVEYEDEGDFFVFGILYDESGNVKYVCYGVPAVFDENPPEELAGYPIWLPLDDEKGFGYWMTYQDAVTGEPLKAILD